MVLEGQAVLVDTTLNLLEQSKESWCLMLRITEINGIDVSTPEMEEGEEE